MKIRIISWNVKGANNPEKRKLIKAFLKSQRANVICLQETKIKAINRGLVGSLGARRFLDWGAINAVGASGGLVVFWDSRVLTLKGLEKGNFTISCRFKNLNDNFVWVFTGIYGPTENTIRELLWNELGAFREQWEDPWCLGGDFNTIRFPRERNREGRITRGMRRFSQVIDDLEVKDIRVRGPFHSERGAE